MRRVAVALTGVLCALSGACADAGTTPLETVADAVAHTLDAQTARASFTVTVVGVGAGADPIRLRGEGAFDIENRIGSMTVNATDLSAAVLRGDLRVISHGPVQFLQVPPGVPVGQAWVVVDHRTFGDVPIDPLRFDQLLAADPSTCVRWLRGAGDDVRSIGTEEVRGEPTTRFSFTIDFRRAVEQLPSDLRASMGRLIGRFNRDRFPAEVWIGDDDGRIRRIVVRFDSARAGVDGNVLSEELFGFGTKVAVAPPTIEASAQIGDVAKIPPTTAAHRRRQP